MSDKDLSTESKTWVFACEKCHRTARVWAARRWRAAELLAEQEGWRVILEASSAEFATWCAMCRPDRPAFGQVGRGPTAKLAGQE